MKIVIFQKMVPPGRTYPSFKLFTQPMDRAEVLHASRYDLSSRQKHTTKQNDLVLPCEKSTFPKKNAYICPTPIATQHARCHKEHYSPRGQAVSTSHLSMDGSEQAPDMPELQTKHVRNNQHTLYTTWEQRCTMVKH